MADPPEWLIRAGECDIRLEGGERRAILAPLFLCPKAVSVAAGQIGINTIVNQVAVAKARGVLPPNESLGRQAVDNVVNCRPTQLAKVTSTANIINLIIETKKLAGGFISSGNIVSCVFRIRGFSATIGTLKLSEHDIAVRAGVDERFVRTLSRNYRLHLVPVLAILGVLKQAVDALPPDGYVELKKRFADQMNTVVVVDDAPRTNIEKLGTADGADAYLLNERNVEPAPRNGHLWALDRSDASKAS